MNKNSQLQEHKIKAIFDENSQILILGSFPSVKSRAENFFYAHPQNRFWKVLAAVFETNTPETTEEKKSFLLANHIALWDVIASCEISGSADNTIKNVTPNNLNLILDKAKIQKIYLNGGTAYSLYKKFLQSKISLPAEKLPSTSPANARYSLEKLIASWQKIKEI